MPKVINRRNERLFEVNKNAVYVGRPSKFGNPFVVGKDGSREEVIEKFRLWLNEDAQKELRIAARSELRGKDLVCWCAPLACHADVLLKGVN